LFGLTVAEALAGFTREAARALGLSDRGVLDVGLRADVALWPVEAPSELAYRIGSTRCIGVVREGAFARGALTDAAV
jgi:imidazolonepropionase